MFKHKIYFSREKNGLGCLNARAFISRAVRAALEVEGITEPCEVSVLLTDDEGIHALNKQFRQVDRATDVLSFPANNFVPGAFDPDRGSPPKRSRKGKPCVLPNSYDVPMHADRLHVRCAADGPRLRAWTGRPPTAAQPTESPLGRQTS